MAPLTVDARDVAAAAEWSARLGAFRVGTRDRVDASWLSDELYGALLVPDTWIAHRLVYRTAILNEPSVSRDLADVFWGYTEIATVRLVLSNAEGEFDALWDEQGQPATLDRYDRETGVTVREFEGVIDAVSFGDDGGHPIVSVDLINQDLSALDTLIPRRLTGTEIYGATCPEPGRPTRAIIGSVRMLPLWRVVDDVPAARFVFEVGEGACQVSAVYRNRIGGLQPQQLQSSEYTVSTTLFPGRTVVRTFRRQLMGSGGGHHTLYADVTGPSTPLDLRNPAYAAAAVLGDPTWGCGLTVNMAAMGVQAAAMPAPVRLDGVIGHDGRQRAAREVLREILMVRGGRPIFEPEFGWSVTFDSTAPTTARMTLHDGPGEGVRTLLDPGRRVQPPLNQRITTLLLKYGYDFQTGAYTYTASPRTVGPRGKVSTIELSLLGDHAAADHVAYYYAHRLRGAEDRVEGAVVHEDGRRLQAGDIVRQAAMPHLGFAADEDRLVLGVVKQIGGQQLHHCAWDDAMYTHVPGAPPPDRTPDTTVVPPPVTAFSVVSSTLTATSDRGIVASVRLQFHIPPDQSIDAVRVEYCVHNADAYGNGLMVAPTAATFNEAAFDGLGPGIAYDFRAVTLNGTVASSAVFILNHTAGSDSAPSAPTSLAVAAAGINTSTDKTVVAWVRLGFTAAANPTLLGTRVDYRKNGETVYGNAQVVTGIGALEVRIEGLVPGQAYDYRAISFNASADSSGATLANQAAPTDTVPSAPTSLSITASGTNQGSDGSTFAWVRLQFTVAANPTVTGTRVDFKRNGTSIYGGQQLVQGTGTLEVEVPRLIPGIPYDYRVVTINGTGESSATALNNQVAPGDTTGPGTPTSLGLMGHKLTSATFSWVRPADADVRGYNWDLRTAADGGGSVVQSGFTEGTTLTVNDSTSGYVTRHFRVQAVDFSGNLSATTASVSVTFGEAGSGDLGSGSVTDTKIGSGAVTDTKIGTGAVTEPKIGSGAVTSGKIGTGAVGTNHLQNESVDTDKRQAIFAASTSYNIAAGATDIVLVAYTSLGHTPIVGPPMANNDDIAATLKGFSGSHFHVHMVNLNQGSASSGTVIVQYW